MESAWMSLLLLVALALPHLAVGHGALKQALESLSPTGPDEGNLWVVLAAGSNEWYNYRHQADVCHAYQIVHAHGVPDERIIVFMYDDIANNTENPTPGVIINRPNGSDVYHGVPKDYTGKHVNASLFLKVLEGKQIHVGSRKTLNTTENDRIFVYYTDHGSTGLVVMGDSYLMATDLIKSIKSMHKKKKYSKMVFYVEACESGSMFDGILSDKMNVYATTASNASTSSFACYWDESRQTFLGDVYSIKWLEDSDVEDLTKESLDHQFEVVKNRTTTSEVSRFGDTKMGQLPVAQFQGSKVTPVAAAVNYDDDPCLNDAVASPDVLKSILMRRGDTHKLRQLEENRRRTTKLTYRLVQKITSNRTQMRQAFQRPSTHSLSADCYSTMVHQYHTKCYCLGANAFALTQLYVLNNLCQMGFDVDHMTAALDQVCRHLQPSCAEKLLA